ncbi:exported hypothetical protein [metagenome]|uniref:Uncharacterized protein n=1 Tax=metagenome TaxID=256318 RepID=A0A2P2BWH2_9ZZZZ
MTTFLALVLFAAAFAALVSFARHDGFVARRTPCRDELGAIRQPRLLG